MLKLFPLSILLLVSQSWANPVLVLMPRGELKSPPAQVTVLREFGSSAFAVIESSLLGVTTPVEILDRDYAPGHYLLVRGAARSATMGYPILWQDNSGALLKMPQVVSAAIQDELGGVPLAQTTPSSRPSRRPSHLDDPALDAWLADLGATVNADSLFSDVVTLAAWNRYSRWTSNDDAANWVLLKFQSYGLDSTYLHPFTASGSGWSRTAYNVIGVQVGTVYPDSIVIIGGHMDATSQNPSVAAPGAEDNATGTAGVIEAARLLSQYQFSKTLMYVAFNGEEQGLQGSAALASQMAAAGRDIVAVINMDMIGYLDPAGADLWIEGFYTGTSSVWLMDVIEDNCLQFTDLVPYRYPSDGWGSDHSSFHSAGYPAILSIENEYDSYACYHQTCDLPSNVTATFLRKMALVNIVSGAELALPIGTGSISGNVTLENAPDFSGVLVRVIGGSAMTQTVESGFYELQNMLAGTYDLAFSRTGWISDTLASITVLDDQATTGQDISLAAAVPGSISGAITVSGGSGNVTDAIVSADGIAVDVADDGTYELSPMFAGEHVITSALNDYSLSSIVVTLGDGQNLTGVDLTLYPLWTFEESAFDFNNNGSGWAWGTDATAGYHSATHVWGTVLGANYVNCGNYPLDTPPFSLANLDSARLTFWHWYDIEPSGPTVDYDGANVKIAHWGQEDWQVIQPVGGYPHGAGYNCNPIQNEPAYNGTSGSWLPATFDLTPFVGQVIRIRFHLGSDQGVSRRGWYIDDFALLGWNSFQPNPPDAVEDLTVYPLGDDLQLRWSPVSGAATYRIFRSENVSDPIENWTLLGEQADTIFLDDTASGLTKAFYLVIAVN